MADYEGMDEAQLKQLLDKATSYDERSSIRKAIRKLKGSDSKKKVGSANYRRAGYQAPTTVAIPNSVTGNILPNKVTTENLGKVEVPNSKGPTISYLKGRSQTVSSPRTDSSGGRRSTSSPISAASPRGSVSSYTSDLSGRNEPEDVEGERSAGSVTGGRTPSPLAHASKTRVNGVTSPVAPPSSKEVSPPPREPTPPPPKEPTPPPPREPTPPPPKEPTPPPPREPTPPPPREPTPEEEPDVGEEEVEEAVEEEVEEEEVELEVEEEEEEEEEEYTEGVKVNYDSDDDEEDDDRRKRSFSPSRDHEYRATRSTKGSVAKTVVPLDVLTKKEEGVDGGDFRKKLQKANNAKIDTTSAFPQAKPKGEQVDFRNVLKKKETSKVDTTAAFPQAKVKGEQIDFRNVLKKTDKNEPVPSPKPSRSRRHREEMEDEEEQAERQKSASPETPPAEETEEVEQEEAAAEHEEEEEEELKTSKEEVEATEEAETQQQQDAIDSPSPSSQQTGGRGSADAGEMEEDSYEARQAERRRRREQRKRELAAITDDKPSEKTTTSAETDGAKESSKTDSSNASSGTGELDSYEARREARRKAREERLKAASARGGDDSSKMSYKERKAMEARNNAKDSRNKWENREEDSGAKKDAKPNFKKKDSATQQLLAWCQHKTKFYENVEIKDFRSSWSDGLAFCAIMHSFLPDKIPYDDLTPEDKRKNFTLAFEAAKDAGIPEMLDVDDMLMVKIPDAKSIMTFLVTIYQHFNS